MAQSKPASTLEHGSDASPLLLPNGASPLLPPPDLTRVLPPERKQSPPEPNTLLLQLSALLSDFSSRLPAPSSIAPSVPPSAPTPKLTSPFESLTRRVVPGYVFSPQQLPAFEPFPSWTSATASAASSSLGLTPVPQPPSSSSSSFSPCSFSPSPSSTATLKEFRSLTELLLRYFPQPLEPSPSFDILFFIDRLFDVVRAAGNVPARMWLQVLLSRFSSSFASSYRHIITTSFGRTLLYIIQACALSPDDLRAQLSQIVLRPQENYLSLSGRLTQLTRLLRLSLLRSPDSLLAQAIQLETPALIEEPMHLFLEYESFLSGTPLLRQDLILVRRSVFWALHRVQDPFTSWLLPRREEDPTSESEIFSLLARCELQNIPPPPPLLAPASSLVGHPQVIAGFSSSSSGSRNHPPNYQAKPPKPKPSSDLSSPSDRSDLRTPQACLQFALQQGWTLKLGLFRRRILALHLSSSSPGDSAETCMQRALRAPSGSPAFDEINAFAASVRSAASRITRAAPSSASAPRFQSQSSSPPDTSSSFLLFLILSLSPRLLSLLLLLLFMQFDWKTFQQEIVTGRSPSAWEYFINRLLESLPLLLSLLLLLQKSLLSHFSKIPSSWLLLSRFVLSPLLLPLCSLSRLFALASC